MQSAVEALWDVLSDEVALFFGRECLSVTSWMLMSLLARRLILWLRMQQLMSFGLISHLPLLFTVIATA